MNEIVYLDHAASSWPKPPQVFEAMQRSMDECGNPGRGSHRMAVQASRTIFEARKNIAILFGIKNPNDIAFALNTTSALNLAIKGYLRSGDHVICTMIEHNSVRRPLEYLKKKIGIEVTYIESDLTGQINLKELTSAIRKQTRLIICNHSSNLLGNILPLDKISEIAQAKGVALLVDAAQTAGVYPLDISKIHVDMIAFPGHKGLLGPQGTGGLYINPNLDLEPLLHGGTGSQSEETDQPNVRPDRYEAGTQNTVGIAGLNAGVAFILEHTVERIHAKENKQTQYVMEQLSRINGVQLLGPPIGEPKTGIISFRIHDRDPSETAYLLDRQYQIAVRAGYHCTPLAHETVGTLGTGAVRASLGYFTTDDQLERLIQAVKEISAK